MLNFYSQTTIQEMSGLFDYVTMFGQKNLTKK